MSTFLATEWCHSLRQRQGEERRALCGSVSCVHSMEAAWVTLLPCSFHFIYISVDYLHFVPNSSSFSINLSQYVKAN